MFFYLFMLSILHTFCVLTSFPLGLLLIPAQQTYELLWTRKDNPQKQSSIANIGKPRLDFYCNHSHPFKTLNSKLQSFPTIPIFSKPKSKTTLLHFLRTREPNWLYLPRSPRSSNFWVFMSTYHLISNRVRDRALINQLSLSLQRVRQTRHMNLMETGEIYQAFVRKHTRTIAMEVWNIPKGFPATHR